MRALKTSIVVVLIALGFLGGFFVGWALNDAGVVRLGGGGDTAGEVSDLQERILEELDDRYYREVDVDELKEGSVKGMLEALDDPYTAFLNADETQRLKEKTEGEYSGIGAALEKKNGALVITRVFEGSPAAEAGLRPGDAILAIDGEPITTWDEASALIRANGDRTVDLVVLRDGAETVLVADLVTTERYADPEDPCSDPQAVGFLGVSPQFQTVSAGPADVVRQVTEFGGRTVQAILGVPERMVGVWQASFGGEERDVCSPVGIVGAGRIGGEIVSADDVGAAGRVAGFLALLASFNMAIAVFNLVPLLPLDGGHIAGALWEGVKRAFARLTGRPEPAPVDVAKALPLAYAAAAVLIGMSVLLLYADLVNPVRLPG